tara:strand:+ start:11262 stop:12353 length:1092 start_codon:yes stop_codon:yes gene_type:complete
MSTNFIAAAKSPKVFLHIGMGKSASSFLQNRCFPKLSSQGFQYNPPPVMDEVVRLMSVPNPTEEEIDATRQTITTYLRSSNCQRLFLSREHFTTRDWKFCYADSTSLLKRLFPEAKIIVILRHQVSWTKSLYREAVHQGVLMTYKEFLNFDGTNIRRDAAPAQTDPFAVDFFDFLTTLFDRFDRDNVLVIFFENFKKNPLAVIDQIGAFLGGDIRPDDITPERRGLSGLSIRMLLAYHRFYTALGIDIPYVHEDKNPTPFQSLAQLPLREAWSNGSMLRVIATLLSKARLRMLRCKSWTCMRDFHQSRFDNLIYADVNIFKPDRLNECLEQIVFQNNKRLCELYPAHELPPVYTRSPGGGNNA